MWSKELNRRIRWVLTLIFLLNIKVSAAVPWEDGRSRGADLEIMLVTFGPGDEVNNWWGHTTIVVTDSVLKVSKIYNFGLFSFDDDMLAKFATGRLVFWAGDAGVGQTLLRYRNENREIRIQVLDLTPAKKLEMARTLAWNVRPENREYLYDHYYDNCSTRLRDIIDKAVDGQFATATKSPSDMTLRDHTRRYSSHVPPMEILLMYLMNNSIDQPIEKWDDMFLPDKLEQYVGELEYNDESGHKRKLVSNQFVYFKADRQGVPEKVPVHWPGALLTGIILAVIALLHTKPLAAGGKGARISFGIYNSLIGLIIGLPGLALFLMSFFTDHVVTHNNENLLISNPLTFALFILGILLAAGKENMIKWITVIWYILAAGSMAAVLIKIFPLFDQNNWLEMALILPVNFGFALTMMLSAKITGKKMSNLEIRPVKS
ncbi:MAG: DUF4105 domain-containing protein [Calditrichaceae bacterium]